jgi:hypothetical protein
MTLSRQINEFANVPSDAELDAEMGADAAPAGEADPMGAEEPALDAAPAAETLPAEHKPLDVPAAEEEQQGKMAKADLYKLASYSHKLFKSLNDDDELEAWVQAKITKAADYIASVFHYLEYEMKFSEYGQHLDNADTLSEGQKEQLKAVLSEAKDKVKELKMKQAGMKKEKVDEGMGCEMEECSACGGTGQVEKAPKVYKPEVLSKAAAYNKKTRAHHAAMKRIEAEEEMGDEEMEEAVPSKPAAPVKKKPVSPFGKKPSKEEELDEYFYFDTKKGGQGNPSQDKLGQRGGKSTPAGDPQGYKNMVKGKGTDGKKAKDQYGVNGPKGHLPEEVAEAKKKPSSGLSKAEKSSVVKKAKAGGDIGKPGKGFAKVEKAAAKSGAKDPKAVAAAAMWKNIKEAVKVAEAKKADKDYDGDGKIETGAEEHKGSVDKAIKTSKAKETVKESADFSRMQDQLARLNRSESHVLKEGSEADQIRALTKRLLG